MNTIAGMTSSDRMCTPKERPTMKLMSKSHLFPLGLSISASQCRASQNSRAIKKELMA